MKFEVNLAADPVVVIIIMNHDVSQKLLVVLVTVRLSVLDQWVLSPDDVMESCVT